MLGVAEKYEARVREINRTAEIQGTPRARIMLDRFVRGMFWLVGATGADAGRGK
jgi:hypothetical protein